MKKESKKETKEKVTPKYYEKASVKCACGASFEVGSTKEFIETEICSQCHPFYTGKEKIVDALGRVEKFKKRLTQKKAFKKKVEKRAGKKKDKKSPEKEAFKKK